MAKLHFKYGAMNSGKSDTLIKPAYNYEERGLGTITVKPAVDTKGEDWVLARGGAKRRVDVLIESGHDLREEIQAFIAARPARDFHVVLVDESQFRDRDQSDQLVLGAKNEQSAVIC